MTSLSWSGLVRRLGASRFFSYGIVASLWSALVIGSLTSYPLPHIDEVMFSSVANQFLTHGDFCLPIHPDVFGSSTNFRSAGRLHIAGLAATFWLLGTGLVQARLYSWMGGLVGGWLMLRLGEMLYGQLTGWLSAAIYLFSWRIFYVAHVVRPEIWTVCAGLLCLLILVRIRDRASPGMWAGLAFLAAMALDIYPPAIHYVVTISHWAAIMNIRSRRWKVMICFGLGLVAGFALYAALHLFPPRARLSSN